MSRRPHHAGRHEERPPERRRDSEEAERAEPDARHQPAGQRPRSPNPCCPLPGVFSSQPGWHKGRVRRGGESLPQPAAHCHQEALRPAVGPSVTGSTLWRHARKTVSVFYVWLEFYL